MRRFIRGKCSRANLRQWTVSALSYLALDKWLC
jgi:hypothetical protein